MKVFIFDPLWDTLVTPEQLDQLKAAGVEVTVVKDVAPLSDCKELFEGEEERILCLNPDYVGWKLPREAYKYIPNLKAILGAATSFSWIDTAHAAEQGISVCNIRGFSTEAVAEWAVTMMFNVARQTPRLIKDGFPLDYDTDFMKYRGVELHGKTAGIVGLGNIGSEIAKRCEGLGMNVIYWSKSSRSDEYTFSELNELFSNADVVFPAMALNEESKELITQDLLQSMKPSAIFISVIHHLFDQKVILDMVKKNKLFGYGFESEPATFNDYEGNIWAAPAYGWVTDGAMSNSMARWVDNMVRAAKGEFPNKIN